MIKKISELTAEEIYKYIYNELKGCVIDYTDREPYPNDNNIPAVNITYDNCRYCRLHEPFSMCDLECKTDENVIDYQAVREGIYKNDEIEVEEDE